MQFKAVPLCLWLGTCLHQGFQREEKWFGFLELYAGRSQTAIVRSLRPFVTRFNSTAPIGDLKLAPMFDHAPHQGYEERAAEGSDHALGIR